MTPTVNIAMPTSAIVRPMKVSSNTRLPGRSSNPGGRCRDAAHHRNSDAIHGEQRPK